MRFFLIVFRLWHNIKALLQSRYIVQQFVFYFAVLLRAFIVFKITAATFFASSSGV